ncbi:diphthamide biosynthesis protein 3 [Tribonema minus]|uniref:Diphthamide biosynthesis protein 3 n=1 Tax=Tribonema minus TaxID=303371 RepID=A0A835Z4X0_9STRA|nr:diphthamide biosynthesis protein 3 [Tribonema minus]
MADSVVYEEVALADMTFDAAEQMYTYSCPCGDLFEISLEDLLDGEDIAPCPSCTLRIRVLYDMESLPPLQQPEGDGGLSPSTAVPVN